MTDNILNSSITIGTTSLLVLMERPLNSRTVLILTNTGTTNFSISFGQLAVAGKGIFLLPGGTWSESIDNNFIPTNLEVWGVSSAAGGTLAIHERTR
jgi:hypothetical protein